MERNIGIKCKLCNQIMKFDYYINKFTCKCNNKYSLNEVSKNDMFYIENDFKNILDSKIVLNINYQKEDFIKDLKRKIKHKLLIPDSFLKLKKLKKEDIKTIYIPLLLCSFKCAITLENEKENYLYEIKNMIFDEYTNFDKKVLNSLYPVNLYENNEEQGIVNNSLIKEFKIDFPDMNKLIHERVKSNLKEELKFTIDKKEILDIIILQEEINCIYLPIYDFDINYKNKDYHQVMNTNTGKVGVKVPISKIKLIFITIFFLISDAFFFYLSNLIRVEEIACFVISFLIFIIELLSIICLYFLTCGIINKSDNKNKYLIKKLNKEEDL